MSEDRPVVLFHRAEGFYPVQLSGRVAMDQELADHAHLNPGTVQITDLDSKRLWPVEMTQ